MLLINDKLDSQVVKQITDVRRLHLTHKTCIFWGFFNIFVAFVLYLEMLYGTLILSIDLMFPILKVRYLGILLECLLIINAMCHLAKYFKIKSQKPIAINDVLKKVCRISDDEPGFVALPSPPSNMSFTNQLGNQVPQYSPSHYQNLLNMSPPHNISSDSHGNALNSSFDSSFGSNSQSFYGHHDISSGFLNKSDNQGSRLNKSLSPNTSFKSLNRSHEDAIDDVHALKNFLKEQNESEVRFRRVEMALEGNNSMFQGYKYTQQQHQQLHSPNITHLTPSLPPPLSPGYMSGMDPYNPISNATLKYLPVRYQLARPAQQMNTSHSSGSFNSNQDSYDAWSDLNVAQNLDLWTERLRKYISSSILKKVVDEISSVNSSLAVAGMEDIQVGSVSLTTLKQMLSTKTQLLPHLSNILPFLEISTNQEYVVQRIKELNSGGGLSCFRWNGGGEMRGRKWEEMLPTDAALLMHCLCCYMDLRLPSNPTFSDGKPFTKQHIIRSTNKINLADMKGGVYFLEVEVNPPHYDVIYNGTIHKIKKGRSNLFHAILLFFYLIKVKEHGMIGRMSLGMSGINILWIFDN